jgi:hypothetical protein
MQSRKGAGTSLVKKFIAALVVFMSIACATAFSFPPDGRVSLERKLFEESDHIDFVYEDGRFSYVSYLKNENLREERKTSCPYQIGVTSSFLIGVWMWDYRKVTGREEEVVERLKKENMRRVYLQLGDDLEAFVTFVKKAKAASIEVFGLDGAPEYINDYRRLINDVERVRNFNRKHKEFPFDGFQVDVEPYLKKDFNLKKAYYVQKYVQMAHALKAYAGDEFRLSFALPFWFDTLSSGEKPLSHKVIDIADEVVIMSYRTNYDAIVESAYSELCYASSVGKPLFLGIEITTLPNEQHFVINKTVLREFLADDGTMLVLKKDIRDIVPMVRRYEVKAEKLTFHKKRGQWEGVLQRVPPFRSFKGYIIHSYEGLDE